MDEGAGRIWESRGSQYQHVNRLKKRIVLETVARLAADNFIIKCKQSMFL